MSIQYLPHLDPMVEMNFTLERCFGQSPDIPNSVPEVEQEMLHEIGLKNDKLSMKVAGALLKAIAPLM